MVGETEIPVGSLISVGGISGKVTEWVNGKMIVQLHAPLDGKDWAVVDARQLHILKVEDVH